MNKDLAIYYSTDFIESNSKNIRIVYEYTPLCDINLDTFNNQIIFEHNCNENKIVNYYIDTINDKVLVDPDYFKVTIYANSENIKKIKSNSYAN